MVRKDLSDKVAFELRPEGLKERAGDKEQVFQAEAKTLGPFELGMFEEQGGGGQAWSRTGKEGVAE